MPREKEERRKNKGRNRAPNYSADPKNFGADGDLNDSGTDLLKSFYGAGMENNENKNKRSCVVKPRPIKPHDAKRVRLSQGSRHSHGSSRMSFDSISTTTSNDENVACMNLGRTVTFDDDVVLPKKEPGLAQDTGEDDDMSTETDRMTLQELADRAADKKLREVLDCPVQEFLKDRCIASVRDPMASRCKRAVETEMKNCLEKVETLVDKKFEAFSTNLTDFTLGLEGVAAEVRDAAKTKDYSELKKKFEQHEKMQQGFNIKCMAEVVKIKTEQRTHMKDIQTILKTINDTVVQGNNAVFRTEKMLTR